MFYAHTHPAGREHWEPLATHLREVADAASAFGEAFGCGPLAHALGRWHDLGKATFAFQEKVLGAGVDEAAAEGEAQRPRARVDHATAGARYAADQLGPVLGPCLAAAVAGHHGHLPDWQTDAARDRDLEARLDPQRKRIEPHDPGFESPWDDAQAAAVGPIRWPGAEELGGHTTAFLTRMLFSCLVDADRLCTQRFSDPAGHARRPARPDLDAEAMSAALDASMAELLAGRTGDPSPVDAARAGVLAACRAAAKKGAGWFTLEVPTGGGKTLASLRFALDHARHTGQRRIVCALPFTSIIEQTAERYREVFRDLEARRGEPVVLEHHSSLDPGGVSFAAQLATENWAAPLVVTTNVQLFESLFASHGTPCRKLHRLANAILILDEAQAIPPGLMRPVLAALDELVRNFGCTVVLCTATQPAVARREGFAIGIPPERITRIVPEPERLFEAMRRVAVEPAGHLTDEELADRLAREPAALCIVNARRHAAAVLERLRERRPDALHLSAAMCPAHRSDRVAEVKRRLRAGEPCLVISTTVVEAGVDVDFPVVYRALAGFDSVAQAAGRANREGRLSGLGRVVVFETDHAPPPGVKSGVEIARGLLSAHPDPLQPEAIRAYFEEHLWKNPGPGVTPWDTHDVMPCFGGFLPDQRDGTDAHHHNFREAASRFRWIDSATTPVVVPYSEEGRRIVAALTEAEEPRFDLLREAQRHTVAVYHNQRDRLDENAVIRPGFTPEGEEPAFYLLRPEAYDEALGLRDDVLNAPGGLVC
ncbi:CRISPR-associated helicase Cas3' [Phycisphaera mikurensis]|nr:CRISPR-associated helicase Cas3' [Phycisphaera mikurensis]MBB6441928.1 CRISPR-associated endonuclease/helicase Cas3 [Phycisphaera mikurensis]